MFSRNVVRRRKRPRLLFATNMCDKIRKCSTYVKTCQASKSRDCGSFAVTRSELCRDLKLPLQQCGDAELPEGVFWVEQERKWRLFIRLRKICWSKFFTGIWKMWFMFLF